MLTANAKVLNKDVRQSVALWLFVEKCSDMTTLNFKLIAVKLAELIFGCGDHRKLGWLQKLIIQRCTSSDSLMKIL